MPRVAYAYEKGHPDVSGRTHLRAAPLWLRAVGLAPPETGAHSAVGGRKQLMELDGIKLFVDQVMRRSS